MMRRLWKGWLAALLAITVLWTTGIGVSAATVYSIKVSGGKIAVLNGAKTVASYTPKTTAITLSADSDGGLLLCFSNAQGSYSRIKLGKQSTISVDGTLDSLTLSNTLSSTLTVTLPSGASVSTANVHFAGKVSISGTVETLMVGGNAAVTLSSGAQVESAMLTGAGAKLTAPSSATVSNVETANGATASGTGIGKTSSGTGKTTSGSASSDPDTSDVTLKTGTVTAKSGQRLRDITTNLSSSVRAYNDKNQRIDGMVYWEDDDSTRLTQKGSYLFLFSPTDMRYDEVSGEITVNISGTASADSDSTTDQYGQTLDITPIDAAEGALLSSLAAKLSTNVQITDKNGDEISGSFRWVAASTTRVRDGKFYDFTFTPSSSRNKSMRGQIQIVTGGETVSTGGSTITGYRLTVKGEITADSERRRLYEFTEKAESMVTAYDAKGNQISGIIEWADADTARVEKTGVYRFVFQPNTSADSLRGQVRIVVPGNEPQVKMNALNITSGRALSDISTALQTAVTATVGGRTITGKAEWVLPNTTVTRSGSFAFTFTPTDRSYDVIDGQAKVTVGAASASTTARIKIEASDINVSGACYLRDISRDLSNNVTIYDQNSRRIRGSLQWEDSGQYVSKTGSYTFLFTPEDAQYQNVMGDIVVSVGRQRTGTNIRLDITPFEADVNSRLSDLTSELGASVRAYTSSGNEVSGRLSWVTTSTTKVRRTAPFAFQFTPSSSSYRPITGWVTIMTEE